MKLVIDERRCKGCNLCTLVCPYKIFRPGSKANRKGTIVPELDRPERCANCRLQKLYQDPLRDLPDDLPGSGHFMGGRGGL
jgi:2-oxoglutarate ferredoxin oxidoreductase subunit delta